MKQEYDGVLKKEQVKLNDIKKRVEIEKIKMKTAKESLTLKQRKITELNSGPKMVKEILKILFIIHDS